MTRVFAVDAETDGLYGPVWAIGAVVLDDGVAVTPELGIQLDPAVVTDGWTRKNVVPHVDLPRIDSREGLLNLFWDFWLANKEGAEAVADVGTPVEAGLFRACVELDPDSRTFQGPYPLHELATALRMAGMDPDLDRRVALRRMDLVPHNPVDDALGAALMWHQVTVKGGVIRRWRRQRQCQHPRLAESSHLVDLGRRKVFECGWCGRRRVV